MHLPSVPLIVVLLAAALTAASVIWLLTVLSRREKYTRERFAFVAVSSVTTLGATVVAGLAHNESVWGAIAAVVEGLRGKQMTPAPAHVSDHVLMVLVLALVIYAVTRLYENWDGAVSERQHEKQRYRERASLVKDGLYEMRRTLKREPPQAIYVSPNAQLPSALQGPQDTLAWHLNARELLCLKNPSFQIDRDLDWHHEARCWIGINKRSLAKVAIRCEQTALETPQITDFVNYVERVCATSAENGIDFILAIRNATDIGKVFVSGREIRQESETTLLDNLVDFTDYYADIAYRAERQHLPDSAQTLSQVYTPPSCVDEKGANCGGLESYLEAWLSEPGQRQLALLGEYGQGKSTAALMFARKMTVGGKHRVPILIELRGKSPRNMTPEEIVAAWAFPYSIDPRAVMKLLIAGRVFLILEGFDEMAMVGDSEARLSHFRTLWSFCYPQAKILITGRPNFFLDDREMRAALGVSRSAATGPYCEALHLKPFTLEQIRQALRETPEKDRGEILELARLEPKFREIVARGSLLYLVSQLWQRERLSEFKSRINSAFVIDLFVQHSYKRQTLKGVNSSEFMVLTDAERRYFTAGVAAYMASLDLPNQIARDDFEKAIRSLYEVIPEDLPPTTGLPYQLAKRPLRERVSDADDPVTDVANDVRSGGLLVVDPAKSGALRFAHKSFLELLAASVCADKILGRNRETNSAIFAASRLQADRLPPESLKFFSELLVSALGRDKQQRPAQPMPRRLFDLIVVPHFGRGWTGRLLARAALAECRQSTLILEWAARSGKLSRIVPVVFLYPKTGAVFFLGVLLPIIGAVLVSGTPSGHILRVEAYAILASCFSGWVVAISIVQRGRLAPARKTFLDTSAIRLWLSCCVTADLINEMPSDLLDAEIVAPMAAFLGLDVQSVHSTAPPPS